MTNFHTLVKYLFVSTILSLFVACNNSLASSVDSQALNMNINTEQPVFILKNYTKADEVLFGSPLAYLIALDKVATAKALLQTGVDVNRPNLLDETPLEQAIGNNSLAMVNLLLAYGAHVNYLAEPVSCNTLLANANAGDIRFYEMPLDHAYKQGNAAIITVLEQAGAKSLNQCFEEDH